MRWGFSVILASVLLTACASLHSDREIASEKATRGAVSNLVELEAPVAYAPRRSQEMQSALIVLNPAARECLRQTLLTRPADFSVDIEGHLNFQGQVEGVQISSAWPDLNVCLKAALQAVRMGRGSLGPFKLRITTPKPGQLKAKTFSIDVSSPIKKFQ